MTICEFASVHHCCFRLGSAHCCSAACNCVAMRAIVNLALRISRWRDANPLRVEHGLALLVEPGLDHNLDAAQGPGQERSAQRAVDRCVVVPVVCHGLLVGWTVPDLVDT